MMLQDPQVAILMSTYNGSKYLRDQINSIINQTYKNWHLYIRDDGSSDNTIGILKEYTKLDKRITIFTGEKNIGVFRSFMKLLQNIDSDFFMFSDQDDVWLKDKIKLTLDNMIKQDNNVPVCVYTNYQPVDRTLSKNVGAKLNYISNDFTDLIFTNYVTGCTMMINNCLKSKIDFDNLNYTYIYMHDWWLALIASEFGKLVFVNKVTMLYRQHGNNVLGSHKKGFIKPFFVKTKNLFELQNELDKNIRMAYEFDIQYGETMNVKDEVYAKKYGSLFLNSKLTNKLNLIVKYPPKKKGILRTCLYIFLIMTYHHERSIKE